MERKLAKKEFLKHFKKGEYFSSKELQKFTKLPISQVYKLEKELEIEGKIENIGIGVWRKL